MDYEIYEIYEIFNFYVFFNYVFCYIKNKFCSITF